MSGTDTLYQQLREHLHTLGGLERWCETVRGSLQAERVQVFAQLLVERVGAAHLVICCVAG
jgi:hypothetical protein